MSKIAFEQMFPDFKFLDCGRQKAKSAIDYI